MRFLCALLAAVTLFACSGGGSDGGTGGGSSGTGGSGGHTGGANGGSGGSGGAGSISLAFTVPANPAYTNGMLPIELTVTGNPDSVTVFHDGVHLVDLTSPYHFTWNSVGETEGAHQLTASAAQGGQTFNAAPLTVNVDRTAPTIVSRWPEMTNASGSTAWLGQDIGIVFDEPMLPSSLSATTLSFSAGGVDGGISTPTLSADGLTLTANIISVLPSAPVMATLAVGTTFTDRAGNGLAQTPTGWTFPIDRWSKTVISTGDAGTVAYSPQVAVDSNAVTYVAYEETSFTGAVRNTAADRVRVRRFTPSGTDVLGSGFTFSSATGGSFPAIAVDPMGRPVVAYSDNPSTGAQVFVQRFENNAWVALGAAVGPGRWPSLGFDSTGNPVVAFTDDGGADRTGTRMLHVSKWNGTAWAVVAADYPTGGVAGQADPTGPSLSMTGDVATLAYVDSSGTGTDIKVAIASATGWTPVGGSLNVHGAGRSRSPSLARLPTASVVAWEEDDGYGASVFVAQQSGASWPVLGHPLDIDVTRNAHAPSLAVDSKGALVVSWTQVNGYGDARVLEAARWEAGQFKHLGGEHVASATLLQPGNLVLSSDLPVIAYGEYPGSDPKAATFSVARYNGKGVANAFGGPSVLTHSACSVLNAQGQPLGLLSATNCFSLATKPPLPASDLVAYDLNSPLWSDGALKRRWVRLPSADGGSLIEYSDVGSFGFPSGTQLIKEFSFVRDPANPATRQAVETRFLVKRDDAGWEGYTYQWNDAFTDAMLLDGGTTRKAWPSADGGIGHSEYYPSRAECARCHPVAAGNILGMQAGQLNRYVDYGSVVDNPLRVLQHLGLFDPNGALPDLDADGGLPYRFSAPTDTSDTTEHRARAYLAGNCAQCHRAGGERPTRDFRWETTLEGSAICDAGAPFGREINPGDAGTSMMHIRMSARGTFTPPTGQMPPIGTDEVDAVGVSVIDDWINTPNSCP